MDVRDLRQRMNALPPMGSLNEYPRRTWPRRQAEFRRMVQANDPAEFLSWPMIHECLFVGDSPEAQEQLEALRDDWDYWWPAIKETSFGKPSGMAACPETSGNIVHQAYILKQWEDASGKRVKDLGRIFEFGGGYGAMARLCHRLGFRGAYLIHDLPEFLLLQQFYLSNVGITNVVLTNDIEPLERMEFDLFIAACSLSEIPFEVRDEALNGITARNYVILYQYEYKDRDNHRYFYDWAETMTEHKWQNYPVPHYKRHWYLVGTL